MDEAAAAAPMRRFSSTCSRSLAETTVFRAVTCGAIAATVDALDPASRLEDDQVAADRGVADAEMLRQDGDVDLLRLGDELGDLGRRRVPCPRSGSTSAACGFASFAHPHRESANQVTLEDEVDDDRRQGAHERARP